MRRPTLPVILVALLLTGACSSKSDLQDMEQTMIAEFRELAVRQDSLQRQIQRLRVTLLDSLESRQGDALVNRGELVRRLERLEEQLGRVTALTGENQRLLSRLEQQVSRVGSASAAAPGPDAAPGADTAGAPADTGGTDGQADGAGGSEPRELYEASLQQFRRGSYQTARSGLQEFLSRFPDHELAPDARYYVAESYAEAGETQQALEAYGRVVELFPNSRRAASALYKSGLLELERGNVEDARVFFSRVVNGYPESTEATLARDQLRELDGGG